MPGNELPPAVTFYKNVSEAAAANDLAVLSVLIFSFDGGCRAAPDDGGLAVYLHLHLVDVVSDKLEVAGRLVEACDVLGFRRDPAGGVGKDELVGLDALKIGFVSPDIRLTDVTFDLHELRFGLRDGLGKSLAEKGDYTEQNREN